MKREYWQQLDEIFSENKELSKKYENLSRCIHLINTSCELNEEHDKKMNVLNKEIAELNKN